MPLTPRQRELTARHLLAHPDQIPVYLQRRQWEALAALVDFAAKDAPAGLTHTDPALYRLLRQQITEFRIRGWSCLSLKTLQELNRNASGSPTSVVRSQLSGVGSV